MYLVAVHVSAAENCAKTSQIVLVRPTTNDNNVLGELRMDTPRTERTDPALIGWQRLGGFTFRRKIDHTSLHIKTSISESRPPSGKRGRGAQTSSSNTEPVLETAHEVAERDDGHLEVSTAKLTRLVKASNEHARAWREVLDKEGGAREAVGMLCQSDLRLRLYERAPPRQARREYRVSAPPGGVGMDRVASCHNARGGSGVTYECTRR